MRFETSFRGFNSTSNPNVGKYPHSWGLRPSSWAVTISYFNVGKYPHSWGLRPFPLLYPFSWSIKLENILIHEVWDFVWYTLYKSINVGKYPHSWGLRRSKLPYQRQEHMPCWKISSFMRFETTQHWIYPPLKYSWKISSFMRFETGSAKNSLTTFFILLENILIHEVWDRSITF